MTVEIVELILVGLINTFAAFLIITVLGNSLNERVYRWFAVMTLLLIGWVDFAYLGYSNQNIRGALLFYKLNWVFVSAYLYSAYMFYVESFLKVERKLLRTFIGSASILFIILSFFSSEIIKDIIQRDWGNEVVFGDLNVIFNGFAVLVSAVLVYYFVSRFLASSKKERIKIEYFLVGACFLIAFNVLFNVLSPALLNTARYQHFGDYSAVIFLAFTAYAILRRSFLDVKIALAAFLISAIGMLLIMDILVLSDTIAEQGLKVLVFFIFAAFSVLLMRSVLNEIRQREQIEELSREQKDIIDVMGHEIRTPLTAIVQEVNLNKQVVLPKVEDWKSGKLAKDKEKEFIELIVEGCDTIDKASHQATHLVKDMLETARLDKKRFELEYGQFDIIEEAKTAVQIAEKALTEENIKISFDSTLKNLEVNADRTRIRESIDNLISNAVKYKDPNKEKTMIKVSVALDGKEVLVSIKDNGRGIAAEDIPKLGKKFFRLDNRMNGSTIKRPGGTGLGLFVVKGIMEYHKGSLTIKSDGVSKGSEFILKFPKNNN